MERKVPTREEAFRLLKSIIKVKAINHALAVEAKMKHFAELFEEDVVKMGL